MDYCFQRYTPAPLLRGHLRLGGANPRGERIDVTSRYLERGGAPWLPVMGEYHFVRDSRENWPRELQKIRAGGVGIVSTYLFWIYHEGTEGVFDFTGDRDIRAFVEACARQGLEVFLRIGPWCHGEVRNGGLPDWLLQKPFKARDNNPGYLEKAGRWYQHIYDQVEGLFYRDGGPIVGIQIENELVDAPEHLLALKNLAREIGFEAPLWTVTGWNSRFGARIPVDEFLPVFGGYADAPWARTIEELPLCTHHAFDPQRNDSAVGMDLLGGTAPDGWRLPYERYPFATCELGGGIQPTLHRRPAVSPMDVYAMSLVKLGCGNNLAGYYMYHGGINKTGKTTLQESTATGYPNDLPILDYDFQAPLSAYGEERPHYGLLNLLHLFIQDFGAVLAPMEHVPAEEFVPETDCTRLRYAMRTDGHGGFVFVNHHQRHLRLRDVENAVLLPPGTRFPPIDVRGDTAFILPFGLTLGGETLQWATAQLILREGDVFVFAAVPGIPPRYAFSGRGTITTSGDKISDLAVDGITVRTLPWERALRLRRVDGKTRFDDSPAPPEAPFTLTPCAAPDPMPRWAEELALAGPRETVWNRLEVTGDRGFVTLSFPFDIAQLYVDGVLAADKFYDTLPWRLPASRLFGHRCLLACTAPRQDVYLEP